MLNLVGAFRTGRSKGDPEPPPPSLLDEVRAKMDEGDGEPDIRYRSGSCEIRIYDTGGREDVSSLQVPGGPFVCMIGRLYPRFEGGNAREVGRLYSEGGVEALADLNGEFAAIIHDPGLGRLVLMKDHVGTRPIYYRLMGEYLYFSSDFRPLARMDQEAALDKIALVDLLIDGKVGSSRTIARDVRKVRAGTCIVARDGVREMVYWDAAVILSRRLMRRVRLESFLDSLRVAVTDRMEGLEGPYYSYLSGGIDSTLVSLLLAEEAERLGAGPVRTLSYGIDERGWNEERYARISAGRIGSLHTAGVMGWSDFPDALEKTVLHAQESAKGDGGTTYFCAARFAADQGAGHVFSGDGADGLFGGRPSLLDRGVAEVVYEAIHCHRLAGGRYLARYLKLLFHGTPSRGWLRGLRSLLKMLLYGFFPVRPALRQFETSLDRVRALLSPDLMGESEWSEIIETLRREVVDAYSMGPLNAYRVLSLTKSDPSRFRALWNWHRASSTVCTCPFMDRRVAELMLETSPVALYESPRTKDFLRIILEREGLGAEITERGKSGFYAPLMMWYRGPLRAFAEGMVLEGQLLARGLFRPSEVRELFSDIEGNWTTIGTLVNLEIWLRATYGHSQEGLHESSEGQSPGHGDATSSRSPG